MSERKEHEKKHGAFLASRAVDIWGWGTPAGQARAARRTQLMIEQGRISSSSKVLEIGCGTGLFSRGMAKTGASIYALDISWDLLMQAHNEKGGAISYLVGDAEQFPFADNSFDAVAGSSILHHLNPDLTFAEAKRVLQPGGRLIFAEPNMMNPQIALQKNIPWLKKKLGDSPDETAFFRWSIESLLRKKGFINIDVRPYDFLHPLIPEPMMNTVSQIGKIIESLPILREIAGSLLISAEKK